MPTEDLFDDSLDKREGFAVGVCGETTCPYHSINFGLCFFLCSWEKGHGQEECVDGKNGLNGVNQRHQRLKLDILTVSAPPYEVGW